MALGVRNLVERHVLQPSTILHEHQLTYLVRQLMRQGETPAQRHQILPESALDAHVPTANVSSAGMPSGYFLGDDMGVGKTLQLLVSACLAAHVDTLALKEMHAGALSTCLAYFKALVAFYKNPDGDEAPATRPDRLRDVLCEYAEEQAELATSAGTTNFTWHHPVALVSPTGNLATLVVVNKLLLEDVWLSQIQDHLIGQELGVTVLRYDATVPHAERERLKARWHESAAFRSRVRFIFTTPDILHYDVCDKESVHFLDSIKYGCGMILDEADQWRNGKAKKFKSLLTIQAATSRIVLASGTLVNNDAVRELRTLCRLARIWPQCQSVWWDMATAADVRAWRDAHMTARTKENAIGHMLPKVWCLVCFFLFFFLTLE